MELEFAFLADAARVAENGVFDVLGGGFDVLQGAGSFPATKAAMVLLARIKVAPEERKREHELLAEIVAPDGKVLPPEMRFRFVPFPDAASPGPKNWITVALNYQAVTFPVAGEYQFRLSVGNRPLGRVTLEVIA